MKKQICLAITTLAAFSVSAQLLWKVSGNGAKDVSYLFGTHHVAPVSVIDSIPGLGNAICSVDAVVGEIDMAEASNPLKAQLVMMPIIKAPADSTLTKVLSAEQIDSVDSVLAKYSDGMIKVKLLNAMKPSMVSTQLALMQSMEAFPDFDATQQLDTEVQTRARACNREIIGFETLEQQAKMLFGGSIREQADDLMETVRNDLEGNAIDQARSLADAYLTGNLDTIARMLLESDEMDGEKIDTLIVNRNNNWVETLKCLLPEKSVLVCVGCGHLIGPDGLIEQLRRLGYEVTSFN